MKTLILFFIFISGSPIEFLPEVVEPEVVEPEVNELRNDRLLNATYAPLMALKRSREDRKG